MNNEYKKTKELTSEDFVNWAKEIFADKKEARSFIIGYDTVVWFREYFGDDSLYAFVKNTNIMCGEDTGKYIEEFIKEYESKNN